MTVQEWLACWNSCERSERPASGNCGSLLLPAVAGFGTGWVRRVVVPLRCWNCIWMGLQPPTICALPLREHTWTGLKSLVLITHQTPPALP